MGKLPRQLIRLFGIDMGFGVAQVRAQSTPLCSRRASSLCMWSSFATAACFLEAKRSFRRLRGHHPINALIQALRPQDKNLKKAAQFS
jgi:hypothetical protein